jgi:hypothetical protein
MICSLLDILKEILSNKGSMQDKWHNIIKESSQIVIG